jgi:methyl-accepting chemotaxis protein
MLGKDSLAYADVTQGKDYLGNANILIKPYLTAYNPLLDKNGQVIGLLFVGLSQTESAAQIATYLEQNRNSAMLVTILALLLSMLLAYYIGNSISKPIISIAGHMRKLASGDLSVQIEEQFKKRKDEILLIFEYQ